MTTLFKHNEILHRENVIFGMASLNAGGQSRPVDPVTARNTLELAGYLLHKKTKSGDVIERVWRRRES